LESSCDITLANPVTWSYCVHCKSRRKSL
jgi:hypothetical protein